MKKYVIFTIITMFLLVFSVSVFSVSVISCESYGNSEWTCDQNDVCVCEILGDCTDGDLLVYEDDITNLLCAPSIVDSTVSIHWENCGNPIDEVIVRADCEEDQSAERTIQLSYSSSGDDFTEIVTTTVISTTTTTPCDYDCVSSCEDDKNPPFCYDKVSRGFSGCPTGFTCCESILVDCPEQIHQEPVNIDKTCPYECCIDMPGYEYKPCSSGLSCCDHLCKDVCRQEVELGISKNLVFWILVATAIPIIAFTILALKKEKPENIPEF